MSQQVADYVGCIRATGASVASDNSRSLSAAAGAAGVTASTQADVRDKLERRYAAVSDANGLEIIHSCDRRTGSSAQPKASPSDAKTTTLNVRVFIDGESHLVISGGYAHWHHNQWAAPGRHDKHAEPTYLNSTPWLPTWSFEGEGRDCNCDSSTTAIPVPLAAIDQTVTIAETRARAPVRVIEQPTASNRYQLVVSFSDLPPGADWYEVAISYRTN